MESYFLTIVHVGLAMIFSRLLIYKVYPEYRNHLTDAKSFLLLMINFLAFAFVLGIVRESLF